MGLECKVKRKNHKYKSRVLLKTDDGVQNSVASDIKQDLRDTESNNGFASAFSTVLNEIKRYAKLFG